MIIKRAGGYFLFGIFDQRIFMRFVSINESTNDANFIFTSHVDSKLLFYFKNDVFAIFFMDIDLRRNDLIMLFQMS